MSPPPGAAIEPPSCLQLPPPLCVSDRSDALVDPSSAHPAAQHNAAELNGFWAAEAVLFAEAERAPPPLPSPASVVPHEALLFAAHRALFDESGHAELTEQVERLRCAAADHRGPPRRRAAAG